MFSCLLFLWTCSSSEDQARAPKENPPTDSAGSESIDTQLEPAAEPEDLPEPSEPSSQPSPEPSHEPAPDPGFIRIDVEGFYPNGIAINAVEGTIYIGSHALGAIHTKSIFSGDMAESSTEFFPPSAAGNGIAGLRYNGGFLWACSNPPAPELAPSALLQIDPATGTLLNSYPLAIGTHCARVTNDSSGNVFVSESVNSHIWRLERHASSIEPWYVGSAHAPTAGEMGFSGIAMTTAQESILTGHLETGEILRIPVNPDGSAGDASPDLLDVEITSSGIDGMRWHEGQLYAVRDGSVLRLTETGDGWSAEVLDLELDVPTALVFFRGGTGELWAVESQLGHLLDGDESTAGSTPFRVVKLPL
jgi:hypothetical protein